jgi:transposase
MTMGQKRNAYSKEFKEQAVAMLNSGRSGKQIEAELGLCSGLVYRWRDQMRTKGEEPFPGNGNDRDQELARLRRELAQAQEERDILRKAVAIFSNPKK